MTRKIYPPRKYPSKEKTTTLEGGREYAKLRMRETRRRKRQERERLSKYFPLMKDSKRHCIFSERKLGYLAGIIDGEGCIRISKPTPKYNYCQLKLDVGHTNFKLIDWLQSNFGGAVYEGKRYGKYKPAKYWCLHGPRQISALLEIVLPYLIVKREHAKLAIGFQQLTSANNHLMLNEEDKKRRLDYYNKLKVLNR